ELRKLIIRIATPIISPLNQSIQVNNHPEMIGVRAFVIIGMGKFKTKRTDADPKSISKSGESSIIFQLQLVSPLEIIAQSDVESSSRKKFPTNGNMIDHFASETYFLTIFIIRHINIEFLQIMQRQAQFQRNIFESVRNPQIDLQRHFLFGPRISLKLGTDIPNCQCNIGVIIHIMKNQTKICSNCMRRVRFNS